jgi:hypothetical protein
MGLKVDRLWVMGQIDSTCSAPPRSVDIAAGSTPAATSYRISRAGRLTAAL